jgi:hypothetical protein
MLQSGCIYTVFPQSGCFDKIFFQKLFTNNKHVLFFALSVKKSTALERFFLDFQADFLRAHICTLFKQKRCR